MSDDKILGADAACLFCRGETYKRLTGVATIGDRRGSYSIPLCSECWHTKLGSRSEQLKTEIIRQVIATPVGSATVSDAERADPTRRSASAEEGTR